MCIYIYRYATIFRTGFSCLGRAEIVTRLNICSGTTGFEAKRTHPECTLRHREYRQHCKGACKQTVIYYVMFPNPILCLLACLSSEMMQALKGHQVQDLQNVGGSQGKDVASTRWRREEDLWNMQWKPSRRFREHRVGAKEKT